jgi:hypothetical protein
VGQIMKIINWEQVILVRHRISALKGLEFVISMMSCTVEKSMV